MELRKKRKFSKEFKIDTISMIKLGNKSVPQVAEELEIEKATLL